MAQLECLQDMAINRAQHKAAKMRIVIVDDIDIMHKRLASLLEECPDVEIVGNATTGGEGIEVIRAARPHVVLLDLRLPDGSGLDVMRTVKKEQPDTTVIIMSLYAQPEVRTLCLKAGADHFLDKFTYLNELPKLLESINKEEAL